MKVTREQAAANRERILDAAARLFRERGLDGIGVADLMKDAGLTHGGFYGHFESKQALMAQACERALVRSAARWRTVREKNGRRALAALLESYLSKAHLDDPGAGCALATLGSDIARQGPAVRRGATNGARALLGELEEMVPGRTTAARRKKALALFASIVGGIVLARAVDAPLSSEILKAVSESA